MTNKMSNSQRKKDIRTLSNPLSGDTKQGGINPQDDTKLQIERSASLLVDTHAGTNHKNLENKPQKEKIPLEGDSVQDIYRKKKLEDKH